MKEKHRLGKYRNYIKLQVYFIRGFIINNSNFSFSIAIAAMQSIYTYIKGTYHFTSVQFNFTAVIF